MRELSWIALAVAVIVVLAMLTKTWEPFALEFVDSTNMQRTDVNKDSSYAQVTNNVKPPSDLGIPPVTGMETPFRVNLFNSFVPT